MPRLIAYKILLLIFLALNFLTTALANAPSSVPGLKNFKPLGTGRLSFLMLDIYDATLYAPDGQFEREGPFALHMLYLRPLKGEKIAERSAQAIAQLGFRDTQQLNRWLKQMRAVFPDVAVGDQLLGVKDAQNQAHFYLNNRLIGSIHEAEFSQWFFDIWLAPATSHPRLRAQLLNAGRPQKPSQSHSN